MKVTLETLQQMAPDEIVVEHTFPKNKFFLTVIKNGQETIFGSGEISLDIEDIKILEQTFKVTHAVVGF